MTADEPTGQVVDHQERRWQTRRGTGRHRLAGTPKSRSSAGKVTFLAQKQPVDEHGRALYAIARSIVRVQLDQLIHEDLEDLGRDRRDVTLRQLAKLARLDRDKGMRGDGFEWAVHEAVLGEEPTVV